MLWIAVWGAVAAAGALGLAVTVQGLRFERRVAREARSLATLPPAAPTPLASPESLPAPVRRYLEVSGAAARPPLRAVRLRHGGTLVLSPGGRPLPVRGRQYFTLDPPGFVWWGRIRAAPGVWIDGRDRLVAGEGNMLVRLASTFTIADVRGRELDEGALHRLLAEALWMPTLLRDSRYVTWTPVDAVTARATLRVRGREVSGEFRFGPDGLPTRFTARRHHEGDGGGALTPWVAECEDFRAVDGLRVPFRMTATWELPTGSFPYGRWQVEAVELDTLEPW